MNVFSRRITKDFYNKKFKEYTEKQQKLIIKMNLYDKADKEHYITANNILILAQRVQEVFEGSEVAEKRQLLNFLLQNLELKGKKLIYKLKTPFDTVLLAHNRSDLLRMLNDVRTYLLTNSQLKHA